MSKLTLKRQSLSCTDPLYAAHALGHDYGVDKLAKDLFQQPGVMYNKLNPENDSNHLYLRDAIHLTELADDDRIVSAWCHSRGGVFVKLPAAVNCDEELSDQLLMISEQMGIALAEIRDSRADGVITPDEFERIGRELTNTVREVLSLKAVVSSQVRELPIDSKLIIHATKVSDPFPFIGDVDLSKSKSVTLTYQNQRAHPMSDIADVAAIEQDIHIKAALGVRQPSLPFTGRCHYCLTKITGASHFCDADCRHDYERLKANGRS